MGTTVLSDIDRLKLLNFPDEVAEADRIAYFLLTGTDKMIVRRRRGDGNRLGFALQYCTLRFLGFVPADLSRVPQSITTYLAGQLDLPPDALHDYGAREQTRTQHLNEAMNELGFRDPGPDDSDEMRRLAAWFAERALEHDEPKLLFRHGLDYLRAIKVVRPGLSRLERMVGAARENAEQETYRRLAGVLMPETRAALDRLLEFDDSIGSSPIAWLKTKTPSAPSSAIVQQLKKLEFARSLGASEWNLSSLNPNRIKFLARLTSRAKMPTLELWPPEKRYPALVAFLAESITRLTDEVIDLFADTIAGCHQHARREVDRLNHERLNATYDNLKVLADVASVVIDEESVPVERIRPTIYAQTPREHLGQVVAEAKQLARTDDSYFDVVASRWKQIRKFAPDFIKTLEFRSNAGSAALVDAIEVLRQLNVEHRQRVPDDSPLGFAPESWRTYIENEGNIDRKLWELCILFEIRDKLRSADLWVVGSRKYTDLESCLIDGQQWEGLRTEACALLGRPAIGVERRLACQVEFTDRLAQLDCEISTGATVTLENGELKIKRPAHDEPPPDNQGLPAAVAARLPKVQLTDLLIEVDSWCPFTQPLGHGSDEPGSRESKTYLLAAILAQACNFGLPQMAEAAELKYERLVSISQRWLRPDTLKAAMTVLVNYHHQLPLAKIWGDGTLSSSDGQRFPVRARTSGGRRYPLGGITFHAWTSNEYSQIDTKVISSTMNEAAHVLDGVLGNETDLTIVEHAVEEPEKFIDLLFALFDLLGLQFAPRLRDLGTQCLYRVDVIDDYMQLGNIFRGTVSWRTILERWDDLLRVAASMKMGFVNASLLISRLQSSQKQSSLLKSLQEYGRAVRTLFVLRYAESEEYRKRIDVQLSKGESLHALRRHIFFANGGQVPRRHIEEHDMQLSCLSLVTNAVIVWNATYMESVLQQLRQQGWVIKDEAIVQLSPTAHSHVAPHGKYHFDWPGLAPGQLRPLRQPGSSSP